MEPTDHVRRGGRRLTASVTDLEVVRQRALLVGVVGRGEVDGETDLAELAALTDTAGSDPVERILVRRDRPSAATYVGPGQLRELVARARHLDVDVVVFDNELSPAQQRNLQAAFECDVVDRVAVILDIFAQHAHTKEGMIQVELAQHRYRLPRLRGRGTELSRLGAGIGTRGPGETKLETDRRRILQRIAKLERELRDAARARATQGRARRRSGLPTVAIVGYTNAGKSTLFNRLTGADVLVEDRLFATVASTIRRLDLRDGFEVLVSDTVGFVRKLPHELVESFRSTLEEVADADLLLHVVDAADPRAEGQIEAVRRVLAEIGAADNPELLVLNKVDAAEAAALGRLANLYPEAVAISAATGKGLDDLEAAIRKILDPRTRELELVVPYDRGEVVAELHSVGTVLDQRYEEAGIRVRARVPEAAAERLAAAAQSRSSTP